MMPGPLLVAVIGQTTVQGFRAVVGLLVGHALLELLTVALLIAGVRTVLERPRVRGAIGLVGGAALLWMSVDMLRAVPGMSLSLQVANTTAFDWPKLILWGAAVCAANPYFTGWWATVGAGQLAHMAPRMPGEYLAFYLGHQASDFSWYALIGVIIVSGRRFLTDDVYRTLILACGIVIGVLALWFLAQGVALSLGRRADARGSLAAPTS